MRARAGCLAVAVAVIVAAGCRAGDADTGPGDDGEDADAALQRALDELVAMPGGPPGAVVVVQQGDDRRVFAAGVARVGEDTAPTAEDHVRVASVAKAFEGATALSLVDEGVLSLDDTIGERLPDLPEAWADVTLRQLLDHTSGVPDFIRSDGFAAAVGPSLGEAPAPAELLSFVEDEPLSFPSGSQYVYSNSDNIAAGLMIEAATGRSYAEVLAEQVLEPLGLDDTSLPEGTEMAEPIMRGYDLDDDGAPEDVTEVLAAGWAWAAGGIVSTPADMNDFVRGYVSGELYEDDDVREAQQGSFIPVAHSEPPGPGENSASMALFRYQTPCGTMYGHSGNTVGYTQFLAATPDGERSVTASMNLQRTQNAEPWGTADATPGQLSLEVFEALQRAEQAAICLALDD